MKRIRAAWQAFLNPESLNVVVAPNLVSTQHQISREQATAIKRALVQLRREQGYSA